MSSKLEGRKYNGLLTSHFKTTLLSSSYQVMMITKCFNTKGKFCESWRMKHAKQWLRNAHIILVWILTRRL